MKATGIVRSMDPLGRVVIPKELRRTLEIGEDDSMEIFTDGDKIILRKYNPGCIFCENVAGITVFEGKPVCATCRCKLQEV